MADLSDFLPAVIATAQAAGRAIMQYYPPSEALEINKKPDHTPVTSADIASHEVIVAELEKVLPSYPVISEEGEKIDFHKRQPWENYWLVDPLDGTRGFIEARNEFVINIALIANRQPVLGVVYLPVQKTCYYAVKDGGAFRQQENGQPQPIHTRTGAAHIEKVLAGYRFNHKKINCLFKYFEPFEIIAMNSALKFCRIAEGFADLYPRFGPTSEWDTAAPQCILQEAGGLLLDLNGDALAYNKESLDNPAFIALGDPRHKDLVLTRIQKAKQEYDK